MNKIRVALVAGLALGLVVLAAPARADGPPTGAITGSHGRVTRTVYHPTNRAKFVQIAVDTHFGYNTAPADADADFVSAVGRISKGAGALRVQLDRLRIGYEANAKPVVDDFRPTKGTPRNRNNGLLPADPLNSAADYEPDVSQVVGSGDWISVFCDDARIATRAFFTVRWNDGSLSSFSERSNFVDVDLNGCPPPPVTADVTVSKTDTAVDPIPNNADTRFLYTMTVRNNDAADIALNVVVTDTLPPELEVAALGDSCVNDSNPAAEPDTITCTYGSVLPGETESRFIDVLAVASSFTDTAVVNTAVVSSSNDANLTNNTSTNTVTIAPFADLGVSKVFREVVDDDGQPDPSGIQGDDSFVYVITVRNSGPSTAQTVKVVDDWPAGLDTPPTALPAGCTFDAVNSDVVCTAASLVAGGVNEYELIARTSGALVPGNTLTNRAEVSSATTDKVVANNADQVTITIS